MSSENQKNERVLHKTCICTSCKQHAVPSQGFSSDENHFLPALLSQYFGFPSLKAQKIQVPSILISGEILVFNPLLAFEREISVKAPLSEIISAAKSSLADLFQYNHFHYSDTSIVLHSRLFERGGQLHDRFSLALCPPDFDFPDDFSLKDPERIRIDVSAVLFDFESNSGWRFYPFHEKIKIIETCEVCKNSNESLVDQHGWMKLTFHKVFAIESEPENPFPVIRFTGSQFRFFSVLRSGISENPELISRNDPSDVVKVAEGECHVFNVDLTENQVRTDWMVEIMRGQATWKKLKHLRMMVLNSAGDTIQTEDPEEKYETLIKKLLLASDGKNNKILFR